MYRTLFVVSALMILGGSAQAQNGMDLYNACGHGVAGFLDKPQCTQYVNRVIVSILTQAHPYICFPRGFDARQGLPIVVAFMRAHPEALNHSEVDTVAMALRDSYPCPSADGH